MLHHISNTKEIVGNTTRSRIFLYLISTSCRLSERWSHGCVELKYRTGLADEFWPFFLFSTWIRSILDPSADGFWNPLHAQKSSGWRLRDGLLELNSRKIRQHLKNWQRWSDSKVWSHRLCDVIVAVCVVYAKDPWYKFPKQSHKATRHNTNPASRTTFKWPWWNSVSSVWCNF